MKITRRIGKAVKPLVNFPLWMGYQTLKDTTRSLVALIKGLFIPRKAKYKESFAEAMQRLNLSDADIKHQQKVFRISLAVFLIIALVVFSYTVYLLLEGSFRGGALGFALTLLSLTVCFRYHFWLFQMKQRRLGCTLREWLRQGLLGVKK